MSSYRSASLPFTFNVEINTLLKNEEANNVLLGIQAIASIFTIVFTAVVTVVILLIIKYTVGLRVDESEESIGLDQSAHGETAYND